MLQESSDLLLGTQWEREEWLRSTESYYQNYTTQNRNTSLGMGRSSWLWEDDMSFLL